MARTQEQSARVNNPAGPAAASRKLKTLVSKPADKRGAREQAGDKHILLTQPGGCLVISPQMILDFLSA